MKKMCFLLLAMGLGVLLMSSGADAISVKLVDGADPITGNYDNTVALLFTNLSPYKFGYIDTSGVFNSITANGWTPKIFNNVASTSIVDFVLVSLTNPTAIFALGGAEYFSPINLASTAYTYGMLTFSTSNGPTGIAVATTLNSPPDGIAPAPEPATLLLLSSVMVVGCGVLYNKIRNRQERRTV